MVNWAKIGSTLVKLGKQAVKTGTIAAIGYELNDILDGNENEKQIVVYNTTLVKNLSETENTGSIENLLIVIAILIAITAFSFVTKLIINLKYSRNQQAIELSNQPSANAQNLQNNVIEDP